MRTTLALLAALVAAPALAAEPTAFEAPVATASTDAPPTSTADQIDAFIRTSPARDVRRDDALDGVIPGADREPHGEVSVGVGTGGYRSVYGRTEIPVGKNGRVSLAFEDSRNGYGYGRGYYGGAYGAGSLGFGGIDRQRCDAGTMSASRPIDAMGGPHGRCVRPLSDW
jgi:hypothetical protein